jgi:general secretion pathway protein L
MIGLDIGSFSIKVVLMQRGFKGPYIEKCVEWPMTSPQNDEDWIAALHKAGIRSPSGRERVVASVPQRSVFTHVVRLPFTDPQQMAQTVAYEMEDQIPLDLEDVVVDYHPIQTSDLGGPGRPDSSLLAVAVPREHLKRYLEKLQKADVDPKALEVDGLALFNFSQHYFKELKGDVALLDVGASKTSVCIVGEEKPRLIRTIWYGGDHLTQVIAQAQNLSLEEAEQVKRNAALDEAEMGEEGISGILKTALQPLVKELSTTFHVYETESQRQVFQIYVCGGTSRLRGLSTYLSHQLGKGLVEGPGIPDQETFTTGIGLALKECLGQRGSRVTFRSGEFAYHKEQTQTRKHLMAVGVAGTILLLLLGGNLYLRYDLKATRYKELQSQVRSMFQQTFPGVKNIVNEVEQTKAAKKEIEKKLAFFGHGSVTVLDLIGELTRGMPKDRVIEVSDLLIEQTSIRMEAQTDSFESVEKFKEVLAQNERFREVTISDAKMSADQSKVRFRISITVAEGI